MSVTGVPKTSLASCSKWERLMSDKYAQVQFLKSGLRFIQAEHSCSGMQLEEECKSLNGSNEQFREVAHLMMS